MKEKFIGSAIAVVCFIGVMSLLSTPASASQTTKANIEDHYVTKNIRVPHNEQVCKTVDVPIYGEGKMDQQGAIVGGLIGGVIGNQIGKGGGKNAATGVGAIAGAIIGGKGDNQIVGYHQEQRCNTVTSYSTQTTTEYSHSTVRFWHDGRQVTLSFKK